MLEIKKVTISEEKLKRYIERTLKQKKQKKQKNKTMHLTERCYPITDCCPDTGWR